MTLQQLKYIIVIAETGSITMAAERLFIAQPSLSKAVAELEKECFSKPWSEKSLSEELINSTARFYTLSNNGELMGYIGANNICGEVYITNVAVGEKYRNNGYGVRLVKYLILQSALENADFVTLEVRKSNGPAIRLYEKFGFKQISSRKKYYKNGMG